MRQCHGICDRIGLRRADIAKIKMAEPNRKQSIYTLGYVYCSVCGTWFTKEQTKTMGALRCPCCSCKVRLNSRSTDIKRLQEERGVIKRIL